MRSVIHGRGRSAYLEMRVTSNADVKLGDTLITSGLDGIYPPGLQVAKVTQVESKASTTFEVVLCMPVAGLEQHKQLLILLVDTSQLAPPESEEERTKKEKINRRVTRDSAKDEDKAAVKEAVPLNADAVPATPVGAIAATAPTNSTSPTSVQPKVDVRANPASTVKEDKK
jgi:rod shape-determining protein MreC